MNKVKEFMLKRAAIYGGVLAAGAVLLQWLNYERWVRSDPEAIYIALVAALFLGLGVWAGARLFTPAATVEPGNPKAAAELGLSARELDVLREIAAGRSNKEIAAALNVSPNTVKTHVARVFEKLGAKRRTEAIARARALGLVG